MHKTSSFGCPGIAFCTEFQGILSYTLKVEAALTEELSPEENFFFCLKSVQFADNSCSGSTASSRYVSSMKHLYASSFNHFP